ncbi:hypothetical protein [Bernardetia litoralis]|uniref:hypothetical protein n=1 Tax=Bernardetia litoralis TaxID=999 RepID=UPI0006942D8B|nr:hypothetical protein [Bernardetia litoralis]
MRYIYHTLSNTTRNFFAKFLGVEPIRIGTTKLISDLQKQGHTHTIHIYTTSFRNQIKIRLMLFYYEIKVEKKKK